ncbi:hypothetical protein [Enterococcus sp.]|uniref:hypothetical protein n=1 Tax=Enterococcus sp. TaxID=35783 RepID=UPI0025BEC522|nr:hypothetical protein [Enterococcus sp.]
MGVKEVAKKQILKMEHIIERINEAEDLLISLKAPALNNLNELMSDIEIGIPTHFMGGGIFQENGNNRWYRIRLEDDLGITDIQNQIRKTVQESTEKRIEELKSELRKMLYYTGEKNE